MDFYVYSVDYRKNWVGLGKVISMGRILVFLILVGLGYWIWLERVHVTQTLDDGYLGAQVLASIAKAKPIALLSVKAGVHRGVADLRGHVRSIQDEDEVVKAVQEVKGVRGINNHLSLDHRLRTQDEIKNDLEITALVKKNLIQEEGLRGLQIHVAVDQGRVVLTGEVPSREQALFAQKISRSVKGVRDVRSYIEVKG